MSRLFMQDTPLAHLEREMMAVPGFGARRVEPEQEAAVEEPKTEARVDNRSTSFTMFPMDEYTFPLGDGCFVGKLVMKKWNRCNGLNCFFDTEDGQKFKVCVWFSHEAERSYRPAYSDIDMSVQQIGTVMRVKFKATASGKTKWLEAEILEVEV